MSDWIPSNEQLGAYFDNELSDGDRKRVEAFLATSDEANKLLEDFSTLQSLGPMIEDRLPSAMYWDDLPDRILARIASESRTDALVRDRGVGQGASSSPRWWERLVSPAGRWATATAAVAVVGLGAYLVGQNVGSPEPNTLVATATNPSPVDAPVPDNAPPAELAGNPEDAYRAETQRVFQTLGNVLQLGETMDVVPGASGGNAAGEIAGSPIQHVSLGAMDQTQRQQATPVVRPGAGPTDAEWFFMSAIKLEKMGRCDLAQKGYKLVQSNTTPHDPLNVAAGAGLTRCDWRKKIYSAGAESTSTLNILAGQADKMYQEHAEGEHNDCARAWQLMVSYLDLARNSADPQHVSMMQKRVQDISRCVE